MTKGEKTATILPPQARFELLRPLGLVVNAPAKINLNLLVGARRDDGYHSLDSLAAKVTLYDRIELRTRDDGAVRLECTGFDCGPKEDNLALRAARLLAGGADAGGVDITLAKSIPPGRGLGGGSSDAAAVLAGLNDIWRLGLATPQLGELGAELGSDVPLLLGPPAARMTGRGQHVQPVDVHDFVAVLCLPDFACSTAEVYRAFDEEPTAMGRQLPLESLAQPPSQWRGLLVNQLTDAALSVCSGLERMLAAISQDFPHARMTGSGSAVFILCGDGPEALAALAAMPEDLRHQCVIVRNNPW